jgi:LacI family transcriptional regulator
MNRRRPATIKDVARLAGVAQVTAARALGGYGAVSTASRDRVLVAAKKLGYYTNALARSMVTRTTRTIGLVVSDIENFFFARLARAVADVARQRGYALVLANTDEDLDREREAVRALAEMRADGLIVVPASNTQGNHLHALLKHHVPIVLLDRSVAGLEADTVMVENTAAAYRAICHLTALGHRRIAVVTRSTTLATSAARIAGYCQALAEAGVHETNHWVRVAADNQASAEAEATALLSTLADERPTAIFTTDSLLAASVFRAIQSSGLTIPADVSLIGFDDADWMSMVRPAVTTVNQPVYELGTRAAERLVARIEGDSRAPQQICLETELILRDSCARPSSPPAITMGRHRTRGLES